MGNKFRLMIAVGLLASFQALAVSPPADGNYSTGCKLDSSASGNSSVRWIQVQEPQIHIITRFYSDFECQNLVRVRISDGIISEPSKPSETPQGYYEIKLKQSVIARPKAGANVLQAKVGHIAEVQADAVSPELRKEAEKLKSAYFYKSLDASIELDNTFWLKLNDQGSGFTYDYQSYAPVP